VYGNYIYKTVVIGAQTWMAENLNYPSTTGSWCYDGVISNCATYGRLYDWATALTVCPSGWHLPSNAEWSILETGVGGTAKLKTQWGWSAGNGTDDYGFAALPGGGYDGSSFFYVGYYGIWWTATAYGSFDAQYRGMNDNDANVDPNYSNQAAGFSVRCLKGATSFSSSIFLVSSSVGGSSIITPFSSKAASSSVARSSSVTRLSSSSSPSFGSLLWDLTVPMYEVQVPSVQDGSCSTIETCAGWWYGYGAEGGTYSPVNADMSLKTIDPYSGDVIPNGNLTSTGLRITLSAPAAVATDKPGIAGLGFNFNQPEGPSNITAHGGYTIAYTSDVPLQFELGWDEATNNYDTWYATLPAQSVSARKTLPWSAFKKDGWGTGTKSWPITEATDHAWALRIRLKNGTVTDKVANFEIQSLRWIQ
jgi:uncharacterized protein (TIGR02145 family)